MRKLCGGVVARTLAGLMVLASLPLLAGGANAQVAAHPSHNASISTPWTAFTEGINVVAGNVVLQTIDLTVPSSGLPTTVARAYSSAAADRDGTFGHGWSWSYGVRLTGSGGDWDVVREDGRTDRFTASADGFRPPPGIYDVLSAAGDGELTLTTPNQTAYRFSAAGLLLQVADRNGNAIRISYQGTAPASLTDTAGRTWTLERDGSGRITRVVDPAGRSFHYGYDASANLAQVTDSLGATTEYFYKAGHLLTQVRDANEATTSYSYDAAGRVVMVTDPAGAATTFDYSPGTTAVTDPLGRVRRYDYDAGRRVTAEFDASLRARRHVWNSANQRTSVTDRNGALTSFSYDSRGNVTVLRDAAGGETVTTYDSGNRPTTVRDPLGRITTYSYDARGNRVESMASNGATTTFSYDARGQQLSMVDPDSRVGGSTKLAFDAHRNSRS